MITTMMMMLMVGSMLRWFTCPCAQTVGHPSSNRLIATRPGVQRVTFWSQV